MIEKNDGENAGDQDAKDLVTPELAPLVERYAAECDARAQEAIDQEAGRAEVVQEALPANPTHPEASACFLTRRGEPHSRHVFGPAAAPVHCAGLADQDDDLETYAAAMSSWEAENPWASKYGPLVHHARKLARKLDADPDAPASLSSAYLQAITRLERFRPGAAPTGPAGDGLIPPGAQGSIFDHMEED